MEQTNTKLSDYTYFEFKDVEYYYIVDLGIFVDKNKKILDNSRINTSIWANENYINNLDLVNGDYYILDYAISIQKWFETYGHFKDEIFNLCNFYQLLDNPSYKILLNYSKPTHINYSFTNYDKIKNILFEPDVCINANEINNKIIKINNLILIKHELNSPMFHMFPKNIVNMMILKFANYDVSFNKNIFITRGAALHLPRNLSNQKEIEDYFHDINYDVINPETIGIEVFINKIKNSENIYITWGGAIVNLCYVKPYTNIFILRSLSYRNEKIFEIFKFLKEYKNLYVIECDDNNTIDMKTAIINKIN